MTGVVTLMRKNICGIRKKQYAHMQRVRSSGIQNILRGIKKVYLGKTEKNKVR